jgi:hypothetical protein
MCDVGAFEVQPQWRRTDCARPGIFWTIDRLPINLALPTGHLGTAPAPWDSLALFGSDWFGPTVGIRSPSHASMKA